MDIKPPPTPPVAIECQDEHAHPIHLEPAQPRVVLKVLPVTEQTVDSGGSVQGGVIKSELDRIDWD